ncbi:hypothetical protein ABGB12_30355 [Actinocorallia sp. B10E7]|uniref:hypothetical protein n=1 Tax=Actinocorallia sp. B10E7 TaxID=3153558 RepID=UPI00325DBA54
MTTTITATPQADLAQVLLEVSTDNAAAEAVTVYRSGADGELQVVRTMRGLALNDGQAVAADFEAWLDEDNVYLCRVLDADGDVLEIGGQVAARLPYRRTWLRDVSHPSLSTQVEIVALPELNRDISAGVHYVVGRPDPVTIADVRRRATFTLTLLTFTKREADDLRRLIGFAPHLLLQGAPDEGGNLYFLAQATKEMRVGRTAWETARRWELACTQVAAPVTPLITEGVGTGYGDWLGVYDEYSDVLGAYGSYLHWVRDTLPVGGP